MEIFKLFGSILIDSSDAEESIDKVDRRAQGTSKTFGEMIGSAAKVGAGIALAMGTAVLAVGGLAVSFSDDLQKSLNGVQASTGATDESMVGMKDTMLAIYNNNFGENFEEIGSAMTMIAQQTGLSGEALQSMTEDALALKDTFNLEVESSILGANQLIKQFGVDGTTAYNLIAQGAQKGLNANGDMLDTLREYGGTFAAQGFSAEEMFNMLSNAAKSGIRDVDLAADAIKEFGIRAKDGSTTSAAGFEALGLSAAKMTADFAKGGEAGKAAFDKTVTALVAMKDPVAQNAAGVALFGTQFEDLGIKGITALVNTQGEINKNVDALGKINDVKYDTFGEAMKGIGRNLQTGILLPLGDSVLPMLQTFQTWIIEKMPVIKNEISYAMNTATAAFKAVSDFIAIEVIPRFNNISYIVKDISEKYFPGFSVSGDGLASSLKGLIEGALNILIDALKFVRDNSVLVENAVKIMGTAFIAYEGYVIASTIATKAMEVALVAQKIATSIATATQWLFNAALSANPIGIVITAIGLLTAAGVALYMNFDTVKSKTVEMWINMENAFKQGVNAAIEQINSLIEIMNRIPGVNAPLIARVRLDTSSNSTSDGMKKARGYAGGTNSATAGWSWTGEEGPELVKFRGGETVIPNRESMAMAGGGVTFGYGAFAGANIMDDYGVDRLMDRVMDRLALKGVR